MARKKPAPDPANDARPPEQMTFEEATAELEAIIDAIESGSIGLEDSLKQRRRGDLLIKRCRSILDAAEQELEHIDGKGDGENGSQQQTGDANDDTSSAPE